jgi:uncharacterized protein with beta-barrel porin domain
MRSTTARAAARLGLDYAFNPNFTAGVAAGAMSTNFNLVGMGQSGILNSYRFAAYGGRHSGSFYIDGLLGFAYDTDQTRRVIVIPDSSGVATGNADGSGWFAAAKSAMPSGSRPRALSRPSPMSPAASRI